METAPFNLCFDDCAQLRWEGLMTRYDGFCPHLQHEGASCFWVTRGKEHGGYSLVVNTRPHFYNYSYTSEDVTPHRLVGIVLE